MDHIVSAANTITAISNLRRIKAKNKYASQYTLPSKLQKMAEFASAAYNQPEKLRGFTLDSGLSNKRFSVYKKVHNGKTKIILAVRGTTAKLDEDDPLADVKDDWQIAMGRQHSRIEENLKKLDEIQEKFPDARIEQAAHSLGALTISASGSERGIRSYAFNPGSSALGGKEYSDFLKKSFDNDHVTSIVKEGDLVSASMIQHARQENLHVIRNHNKDLKKTVDKHYMSNFLTTKHGQRIYEHLKKENVAHGKHIEDLQGMSESSVKRKANRLTKGGSDMAINEGPNLFSGGFHAQYDFHQENSVVIDGIRVPGPGAKLYINQKTNLMYGFSRNGVRIDFVGTKAEKSKLLWKLKDVNRGPTVLIDDARLPAHRAVVMTASTGGQGYDFVDCSSPGAWRQALGGKDQIGGAEWWGGKKAKGGKYVGNGAVDIFMSKPPQTIDDQEGNIFMDIGEFAYHNMWTLLEVGADVVTAGAANLAITTAELIMDASGASDAIQGGLDKALGPDTRHFTLANTLPSDVFKNVKGLNGERAFKDVDLNLLRDDRVPMQLEIVKQRFKDLKGDVTGLLDDRNMAKMEQYNAAELTVNPDRNNDRRLVEQLHMANQKISTMTAQIPALKEIDTTMKAAHKNKNSIVIAKNAEHIQNIFVPDKNTTQEMDKKNVDEVFQQSEEADKNWQSFVIRKQDNAPKLYEEYHRSALGLDTHHAVYIQNQLGKREDFEKIARYKGVENTDQNFQKYQEQLYESYMHNQGYDMEWDEKDGFVREGDKFWVKKGKKYTDLAAKNKRDHSRMIELNHYKNSDLTNLQLLAESGFAAAEKQRLAELESQGIIDPEVFAKMVEKNRPKTKPHPGVVTGLLKGLGVFGQIKKEFDEQEYAKLLPYQKTQVQFAAEHERDRLKIVHQEEETRAKIEQKRIQEEKRIEHENRPKKQVMGI